MSDITLRVRKLSPNRKPPNCSAQSSRTSGRRGSWRTCSRWSRHSARTRCPTSRRFVSPPSEMTSSSVGATDTAKARASSTCSTPVSLLAERRKGVYSQLVRAVLSHASAKGYASVTSRHVAANSAVIIAKLTPGLPDIRVRILGGLWPPGSTHVPGRGCTAQPVQSSRRTSSAGRMRPDPSIQSSPG